MSVASSADFQYRSAPAIGRYVDGVFYGRVEGTQDASGGTITLTMTEPLAGQTRRNRAYLVTCLNIVGDTAVAATRQGRFGMDGKSQLVTSAGVLIRETYGIPTVMEVGPGGGHMERPAAGAASLTEAARTTGWVVTYGVQSEAAQFSCSYVRANTNTEGLIRMDVLGYWIDLSSGKRLPSLSSMGF